MLRTAALAAILVADAALAFSPAASAGLGRAAIRRPAASSRHAPRWAMQDTPSGKAVGENEYDAKRFYVRPDRLLDIATCAVGSLFTFGAGAFADGYGIAIEKDDPSVYAVAKFGGNMYREKSVTADYPKPAKPIELYEFQGCPFCFKVRAAVAILDLDVKFLPCPRDSTTYRPEAVARGGKSMFPYMVDPNTGEEMYESNDIIKHLYKNYGPGEDKVPELVTGLPIALGASFGSIPRLGKGSKRDPRALPTPPSQPLTVWGYEASPFSKVVREVLNELEVPHVWRSCARGSPKRQELFDKTGGTMQLPFMEDPNTGTNMFESAEIVDYLRKTYSTA